VTPWRSVELVREVVNRVKYGLRDIACHVRNTSQHEGSQLLGLGTVYAKQVAYLDDQFGTHRWRMVMKTVMSPVPDPVVEH
jgi:hypothetical protein